MRAGHLVPDPQFESYADKVVPKRAGSSQLQFQVRDTSNTTDFHMVS